MDKDDNLKTETAEEIAAEKGYLAEVKEEEVRASVISEYGFDEENDKERIDKLVAKEIGYKKTLSTAIGQKVNYRSKLGEFTKNPPKPAEQGDVSKQINAALEKERLEDMPYDDKIKSVIKKVAEINGVSVRNATSDPYVAALIEKYKKDKDAEDAALGRKNNDGKGGNNESIDSMPDFDMSTLEGRKKYDDWKAGMIQKGY
jgi:hypothetical protein